MTSRPRAFIVGSLVLAAGFVTACSPDPTASPSPGPSLSRGEAAVCDQLARLVAVVGELPAVSEAVEADDRRAIAEAAARILAAAEAEPDLTAAAGRHRQLAVLLTGVSDALMEGSWDLDDHASGRSPGNLDHGLEELAAAERTLRLAFIEHDALAVDGAGCGEPGGPAI